MAYFRPNTTIETKIETYRNYGLNDNEIQALLTPLSQHDAELRKLSYRAVEKIGRAVDLDNERFTNEKEKEAKKTKPCSEFPCESSAKPVVPSEKSP